MALCLACAEKAVALLRQESPPAARSMTDCLWTYRARVCRVTDGDTVRMVLDLGIFVHTTQAIRVKGVNTPEIFSGPPEERALGQMAKVWVMDWLRDNDDGSEWPFLVRTERDKQSFNRYVADICTPSGKDLATGLIAAGHGTPVP